MGGQNGDLNEAGIDVGNQLFGPFQNRNSDRLKGTQAGIQNVMQLNQWLKRRPAVDRNQLSDDQFQALVERLLGNERL